LSIDKALSIIVKLHTLKLIKLQAMHKHYQLLKKGLISSAFMLCAITLSAQGVSCEDAQQIATNATYNADGPSDGNGCFHCTGATHADWYYFDAPRNGEMTISACGRGINATDSRLWINSGTCSNLNEVAANDDACGLLDGYASTISNLSVIGGSRYYIEWDNRWSPDAFAFDFTYTPTCNNPTNIDFTEVTNTSFKFNWASSNVGVNYDIEYGVVGFIPGSGFNLNGVSSEENAVLIDNLTPGTTYSVFIQEDCGYSVQTANVGPNNQTTNFSAPPSNDLCSGATAVECGQTYNGSIVNATELGNPEGQCGTSSITPGVWFSHTGTGDRITLSLCASNYNTRLMVFEGSCEAYTCVAGNDNSADCSFNRSKLSFNTSLDVSYLIFVSGAEAVSANYVLNVSCNAPCQEPENDDCANATSLTIAPQTECNATAGSNICADLAMQANECETNLGIADVWYSFNSGNLTSVIMTMTLNSAGPMSYALYESCDGTAIDCNTFNIVTNTALNNLTVNTEYMLQVWNGGGIDAGTFDICLSEPIGSGFETNTVEQNPISMYPNPANGDIVNISGSGLLEVSLFSVDGKHISNTKLLDEGTLDISSVESGVYLVSIIQNGKSTMLRLVKE
jgi:hypothetical protein